MFCLLTVVNSRTDQFTGLCMLQTLKDKPLEKGTLCVRYRTETKLLWQVSSSERGTNDADQTNLAAMQNSFKVTRWHLRALQPEKLLGRCMPLDVSMPSIATCPLHVFNLPTKK